MSQLTKGYILPGTVATTFTTDAGNAVPVLGVITIAGGTNIGTTGAGSTVTINLDPTITLTGVNATTFDTNVAAAGVTLSGTTLAADGTDGNIDINVTPKGTGDFKVTLGDVSIDTGNLILPNANPTATQGVIYIAGPYDLLGGGVRMHTYGHSAATSPNFFCGRGAGNFTNVGSGNIGIGENALSGLGSADYCVVIGLNAGRLNSAGSSNVFIGYIAGAEITGVNNTALGGGALAGVGATGSYNIALGYYAASNYVGAESSNIILGGNTGTAAESHVIRIGAQGNGDNQQNKAFIAGIYGVTPAGTINAVLVDSNGQLGSINVAPFIAPWTEITGATVALVINSSYIMNRGTAITATLPATAAQGSVIKITCKGVGATTIAQNAGQTIHIGASSTTTGAGGSLVSTGQYDSIELLCITANTDFNVLSMTGNWTII